MSGTAQSGRGRVVALCGGVGGAKLALGLQQVLGPRLSVVVNMADDFEHLGLRISPDLDTVLYTLGGLSDRQRGWGRAGDRWHWINKPLGIEQKFTFLDETTLPCGPMEYITRQAQGDFALLDHRDDNLWMDAGMVTTQADWSLDFDIGMNFYEWHAPVPKAHELGVFQRALKFLLNLQQGAPVRRLNWTMTVNPLLDTSPENYHKWGVQKTSVTSENVGSKYHLRVELQTLFRLPRSNALAFPIRCYLIRLEDLVTVPKWGRRLHRVLRDLPEELATYKGFIRNRPMIVGYLSQFDDGAETSPGIWPD